MSLTRVADFEGVADGTQAANLRTPGSQSRAETVKIIEPVAVDVIKADTTVAAAASAAIDDQIVGRSLVEAREPVPGAPKISIPFDDGSRNALEVGSDGRPTKLAAALHVEAESGLMGAALGVETRTDLVIDPAVRLVFMFETGELAGVVYEDGTFSFGGGGGTAPASIWPAIILGDSTSFGADLAVPTEERWGKRFEDITGRSVSVRARSGARAREIAWFAGGVSLRATVTGGSVPASGEVTLTGLSLDPWRAGDTDPIPVVAVTDTGTRVEGTLRRSSGNRIFTRKGTGQSLATQTLEVRATETRTTGLMFLGAGTNDEGWFVPGGEGKTVAFALQEVKTSFKAATSSHTGPLVVWSPLDRGVSEAPGTQVGDFIAAVEAWLLAEYGDDFVNVRGYLASPQALTDAALLQPGFAPTADDIAAQNVGTVPPSFRTQNGTSVHLNALGHLLQAWLFVRHLTLRGLL